MRNPHRRTSARAGHTTRRPRRSGENGSHSRGRSCTGACTCTRSCSCGRSRACTRTRTRFCGRSRACTRSCARSCDGSPAAAAIATAAPSSTAITTSIAATRAADPTESEWASNATGRLRTARTDGPTTGLCQLPIGQRAQGSRSRRRAGYLAGFARHP